jgi:hypothetical protein
MTQFYTVALDWILLFVSSTLNPPFIIITSNVNSSKVLVFMTKVCLDQSHTPFQYSNNIHTPLVISMKSLWMLRKWIFQHTTYLCTNINQIQSNLFKWEPWRNGGKSWPLHFLLGNLDKREKLLLP